MTTRRDLSDRLTLAVLVVGTLAAGGLTVALFAAYAEPEPVVAVRAEETSGRVMPRPVATATAAVPLPQETLDELQRRALQEVIDQLTDPTLPPPTEREPLKVSATGVHWQELVPYQGEAFTAKYFPATSFVDLHCRVSQDERSRALYAVDRRTGAARRIQWQDIDGLLQDEATFLALVREARITLHNEADVLAFVNWAQAVITSPSAMPFVCGNSVFRTKATKVDGAWSFEGLVDGGKNRAWTISCDAAGIVTDVDRNAMKLPPPPTREQNRARRLAELQRIEEAKVWWIDEAKQADLPALVAKADLIGIAGDFTSASGTRRLYRVFTIHQGDLLFGDRLGNYHNIDFVAAQFPAVMERRFELGGDDRWLVFLTARTDQGIHRDDRERFYPAYDPAGEHAVLRCTDDLLAKVRRLVAAKPIDPERNATVRQAAEAANVTVAQTRNHLLLARWAAKRIAEWSVEPLSIEPDAAASRERFRELGLIYLRTPDPWVGADALKTDPALAALRDDPR